MSTTTIYGYGAIAHARLTGCTLSKSADPTEDDRDGLTVEEAEEIAREDPSLISVEVDLTDDEIRSARTEAGAHGDTDMVKTCNLALDGDDHARSQVGEILAEARLEATE